MKSPRPSLGAEIEICSYFNSKGCPGSPGTTARDLEQSQKMDSSAAIPASLARSFVGDIVSVVTSSYVELPLHEF